MDSDLNSFHKALGTEILALLDQYRQLSYEVGETKTRQQRKALFQSLQLTSTLIASRLSERKKLTEQDFFS